MLDKAFQKVAVLGAAGKMGRGIALLLLLEQARVEAEKNAEVGTGKYRMVLIDANDEALINLRSYLRKEIRKYAERNINSLRQYFAANQKLVSNGEIIEAFVLGAMDNIRYENEIAKAKDSSLIFEAVHEDINLKVEILATLNAISKEDAFFFTNTSSIPIGVLAEKSKIGNRLIGLHFYNPPAIQKVLEVIAPPSVDQTLVSYAKEISKRLNKITVFSKDVAGYIGNGHLIREFSFACNMVRELARERPWPEAIYMVNRVTQDFLVRPMGIFQVIDFIGVDIAYKIAGIMSHFLGKNYQDELMKQVLDAGYFGGFYPNGIQREGFLKYDHDTLKGVFSPELQSYVQINPQWNVELGPLPEGYLSWKKMLKEPNKEQLLIYYMNNLFHQTTLGATLAQQYLLQSREIERELVREKVANSIEDVDTILLNGFYHLYSPERILAALENVRV